MDALVGGGSQPPVGCIPLPAGPAATTANPVAEPLSPQTLAIEFWRTIPLPVPRPTIPPGYAITGKPAYLVTGGTTDPAPYEENTPVGLLSVRATGEYFVDWGDQARTADPWTGPYPTEGQPWPGGQITHVYDVAATYTVTVREVWSAVWQLGGASGQLEGLQTTAGVPGFRAEQLQAVIVDPSS